MGAADSQDKAAGAPEDCGGGLYATRVPPADAVKRRQSIRRVKFGTTDLVVSELCAGTMTWGSFNAEEKEAWEQMDRFVEHGVNFFDTAELYPVAWDYGKTTEKWMGNWLAARVAEGKMKRSDLVLATKCNPAGVGGVQGQPHGFELEHLQQSLDASLERLQCEYIDLYQLHWPTRNVPIFGCASYFPEGERAPKVTTDGGMDVFERQVLAVKALLDSGKVRYWGLSNENAYGLTMFCLAADKLGVPRPVSVQNDFSMCNRTYENDLLEACYRFDVVGLPYGALAGGVLTGKYHKGSAEAARAEKDRPLSECRMRKSPDFQPRYGMPSVMQASEKYVAIARECGITPCELALAWANQRWFNGAVITGTTTIAQVDECISAFKIDLPKEVLDKVDVVHEEIRNPCCYYVSKPVCVDAPWLPNKQNACKF